MRKRIISVLLSICIIVTTIPTFSSNVSAANSHDAQTIVDIAQHYVDAGATSWKDLCLGFVSYCFKEAYGVESSACCAYTYGSQYIDSTLKDDIPLGADIFFGGSEITCDECGNLAGHIGIYVGNGYVAHSWSGKVQLSTIEYIIGCGYPYRGYGWHGNVVLSEGYLSKCQDFYPCHATIEATDWTTMKTLPCSEKTDPESKDIKTYSPGKTFTATGLYYNDQNNYWYRAVDPETGNEGYIYAGDVKKTELLWEARVEDPVAPDSLYEGDRFWIKGIVTGGYIPLNKIIGGIRNSDYHYPVEPTGPYSLEGSDIDDALWFNKLAPGRYTYYIYVEYFNYYVSSDGKTLNFEHFANTIFSRDFTVLAAPCSHGNVTKIDALPATCTASGHHEYWYCNDCTTYFTNSSVSIETTPEAMVTSALGHDYWGGLCSRCGTRDPKAWSNGTCGENLTWELNAATGELTIFGTGSMEEFTYSSEVPWSNYRKVIKSVVMGDDVTSIGANAFSACENLVEVTIGKDVVSIGGSAFSHCTALTHITIPDNVTTIGDWAFNQCDNLVGVTFGSGLTTIGKYAFNLCTSLEHIVLPDNVTVLDNFAFFNCYQLGTVALPLSIERIGVQAFSGCFSLADVYYGGVKKEWNAIDIGIYNEPLLDAELHFADCTHDSVEIVYVSEGNETHTKNETCIRCEEILTAFDEACADSGNDGICDLCGGKVPKIIGSGYCGGEGDGTNLTWELWDSGYLYISGTGAMTDDRPWASNSNIIQRIVLDEGVTTIGECAFKSCGFLYEVSLPSTLISIGDSAFENCDVKLKELVLPDGVETIGSHAFAYCDVLETIQTPNTLTSIGNYAFRNCYGLEQFIIQGNNVVLGDYVFFQCDNLTTITLGAGVNAVDWATFSGCDNLAEVLVHSTNAVYSDIEGVLFNKNQNTLVYYPRAKAPTSYTVPDGVTTIGIYAVSGCNNLTGIKLPDGVTTIEKSAFSGCANLVSVTLPDSITSMDAWVFSNCDSLLSIRLPDGLRTIEDYMFYSCDNLTEITISENLYSVQNSAFSGCASLAIVYYGGIEKQWNAVGVKAGNDPLWGATVYFGTCSHKTTSTRYETTDNERHTTTKICSVCEELMNFCVDVCMDTDKDRCCDYCSGSVVCKHPNVDIKTNSNSDKTHTITQVCKDCHVIVGEPYAENCLGYSEDSVCDVCGEYRADAVASGYCGGTDDGTNLTWTLNSEGVLSISGEGSMGSGTPWADHLDDITIVVIEDGVETIGTGAFYGCVNLTSVSLGNSITTIYGSAFANCGLSGTLTIPASVKRIAPEAFYDCPKLGVVYFLGDAPSGLRQFDDGIIIYYDSARSGWDTFESAPYDPDMDYYLWYDIREWNSENTSIIASGNCGCEGDGTNLSWTLAANGLLTISGQGAMADYDDSKAPWCAGAHRVVIEEGVTTIGNRAFADCTNLFDVVDLPNTLQRIGAGAFADSCVSGSMYLPKSVSEIGEGAFENCWYLTDLEIAPESRYFMAEGGILYTKDGTCLILGLSTLSESPDILDGVKTIGASAFRNCTQMVGELVLPDSVEVIEAHAFSGCTGLTGSLTIPRNVRSIADGAFNDCEGLNGTLMIPHRARSIGQNAFTQCGFEDVYFLGSAPSVVFAAAGEVGNWDGSFNSDVTLYYLPAYSGWMDDSAIANTWYGYPVEEWDNGDDSILAAGFCGGDGDGGNLNWVLNTDGVLTISGIGSMMEAERMPWRGYDEVDTLVIEEGVTTISANAFAGITPYMETFAFPSTLLSIGDNAFADWWWLTSVSLPSNLQSIGSYAFSGCNIETVSIPDSVTTIGSFAFQGCRLETITIPANVSFIGVGAFVGVEDWIYVSNENKHYTSVSGVLFDKNETTLLHYPSSRDSSKYFSIPSSTTTIGPYAYYGCAVLGFGLTIPDSIMSISEYAFSNSNLNELTISNQLTSVASSAFSACPLEHIFYDGTLTEWEAIGIGSDNEPLLSAELHFTAEESIQPVKNVGITEDRRSLKVYCHPQILACDQIIVGIYHSASGQLIDAKMIEYNGENLVNVDFDITIPQDVLIKVFCTNVFFQPQSDVFGADVTEG